MKEVESVGGENGCGARRNIEQNYPQNAPKTEVRILHLPRAQRINVKHGGNANSRAMSYDCIVSRGVTFQSKDRN